MRRIHRCLNKQLVHICQQAVQLDELNKQLAIFLPANLQNRCFIGSFNKGCLVIATTNPALTTELRYLLPELRDKLRKDAGLYQLVSIKIDIVTDHYSQPVVKNKAIGPTLSSLAGAAVQQAGELCSYLPLKEVLFRLARHASSQKDSE